MNKISYRESHNRLLNSSRSKRTNRPSQKDIEFADIRRQTDYIRENARLDNQLCEIWDK